MHLSTDMVVNWKDPKAVYSESRRWSAVCDTWFTE